MVDSINNSTKFDDHYEITSDLIIDNVMGICGLADDVDEEDFENPVRIRLKLKVPKSLFRPHQINVTIPEDFIKPELITSDVPEIEVPVKIEGKTGNVKIDQSVGFQKEKPNLLSIIFKKILGE